MPIGIYKHKLHSEKRKENIAKGIKKYLLEHPEEKEKRISQLVNYAKSPENKFRKAMPRPYRYRRIEGKCLFCGKSMIIIRNEPKFGQGKYCSQSCSTIMKNKKGIRKNTQIENIMREWLLKNRIYFTEQKPIRLRTVGTLVDFFIEPNICIYCDGDYWHSLEENKKRQEIQNRELIESEYRVIRLTETEINQGKRPIEVIHNE